MNFSIQKILSKKQLNLHFMNQPQRYAAIAELLESLLEPRNLSSCQELVDIMNSFQCIPIVNLIHINPLRTTNATVEEVTYICASRPEIRKYMNFNQALRSQVLNLPFQIHADTIIISDLQASQEPKLHNYVRCLTGTDNFSLTYKQKDFSIKFSDVSTSLSFWRAISYVPFCGRVLKARTDFQQIVPQKSPPRSPQPSNSSRNRSNQNRNTRGYRGQSTQTRINDQEKPSPQIVITRKPTTSLTIGRSTSNVTLSRMNIAT